MFKEIQNIKLIKYEDKYLSSNKIIVCVEIFKYGNGKRGEQMVR